MLDSTPDQDRAVDATNLLDGSLGFERVIPRDERRLARRAIAVPISTVAPGPIVITPGWGSHPFAGIVLRGLVLRRTGLGGRTVVEVLGPGDLVHLIAHEATDIAVLDDRFRLAARRWPGLHEVVREHLARQHDRTCRHLAVLSLPRVEDRIVAVFTDLAVRYGQVTPAGVRIDVPLTHSLIGELVASRRPTVSLALSQLVSEGSLVRATGRSWLLATSRRTADVA